jgi:hypothetical protein
MTTKEFQELKTGRLIRTPRGTWVIERIRLGLVAHPSGGPVYQVSVV